MDKQDSKCPQWCVLHVLAKNPEDQVMHPYVRCLQCSHLVSIAGYLQAQPIRRELSYLRMGNG